MFGKVFVSLPMTESLRRLNAQTKQRPKLKIDQIELEINSDDDHEEDELYIEQSDDASESGDSVQTVMENTTTTAHCTSNNISNEELTAQTHSGNITFLKKVFWIND